MCIIPLLFTLLISNTKPCGYKTFDYIFSYYYSKNTKSETI